METINRVKLKKDDVIFWPIAIGNQSQDQVKNMFENLMITYRSFFPNNKIIFFPYKNLMQFYYPVIISPEIEKKENISFWKKLFKRNKNEKVHS